MLLCPYNRRDSLLPVTRAMCDRLAALDGLLPPAAVARSTPSSPNAYRAVVQQQQLEKTASVPDLQNGRGGANDERAPLQGDSNGPASVVDQHRAALASACADSKSDGCLAENCRPPVTSLSGTFLTLTSKVRETCGTRCFSKVTSVWIRIPYHISIIP